MPQHCLAACTELEPILSLNVYLETRSFMQPEPTKKLCDCLLVITYFGLYSDKEDAASQSPDMVVDNPIPPLNVSLKSRMLPRGDSEGVFECENN